MFVISHPIHLQSFPSSWNRGAYYCNSPFVRDSCRQANRSNVEGDAEKEEKPIVIRAMNSDVINNDKFCSINFETPGIKAKDIHVTVEKEKLIHVTAERKDSDDKTTLIKYEKHFTVDKRKFDLSKVNASYEDGVLSVTLPKKPALEDRVVTVVTEYPPNEDNVFERTLDLPGVKSNAVTIKFNYDEQEVRIQATRIIGSTTVRKHKVFHVMEENVVVDQLKAYLVDGVLTITAPRREALKLKEKEEDGTTKHESNDVVVIPVIQGSAKADSVEITPQAITNDAGETKTVKTDSIFDDAVAVETVNEKED